MIAVQHPYPRENLRLRPGIGQNMAEQLSPSIEPNPTFTQKTVGASTIIHDRLPGERSDALALKQLAELPPLAGGLHGPMARFVLAIRQAPQQTVVAIKIFQIYK